MKKIIGFLFVFGFIFMGISQVFAAVPATMPGNSPCVSTATPSINILSPNGGEVYQAGQQVAITWVGCNLPAGIKFYLSLEKQVTSSGVNTLYYGEATIAQSISSNINFYTWMIPANTPSSNDYLVRIDARVTGAEGQLNSGFVDRSDNLFTITNNTNPTLSTILKTNTDVKAIQSELVQAGYLNGKVDGKIGPMTTKAIQNYQKANNLSVTGRIDDIADSIISAKSVVAQNVPASKPNNISSFKYLVNYERKEASLTKDISNNINGEINCGSKKILSGGFYLQVNTNSTNTGIPLLQFNGPTSDSTWSIHFVDPQQTINSVNSKVYGICATEL